MMAMASLIAEGFEVASAAAIFSGSRDAVAVVGADTAGLVVKRLATAPMCEDIRQSARSRTV